MTHNNPLVTIICICYNQAAYIKEAIGSVWDQTYPKIELIVADDMSTDQSRSVINELAKAYTFKTLLPEHKLGYTKLFNQCLQMASGSFIIDLSGDDVLLPSRVEQGIEVFLNSSEQVGLLFSDAELIDEKGRHVRYFYKRDHKGQLVRPVPDGNVYQEVLKRYFICSPTMMFRKSMLIDLEGYDETLYYEDFDLWVRAARNYQFKYQDEVLVQKRLHTDSMVTSQYQPDSEQLQSTLIVCEKAWQLNRSKEEHQALAERVAYELRHAILSGNKEVGDGFIELLSKMRVKKAYRYFWSVLNRLPISWQFIYRWFY
ncbi:glycosyltransferase [Penaeicola halotolerans]|uniref:glycosyltransferase n=1 Tax=Penaeicola halotolerans TaxID=2793196 RepID=UPI001CF923C9|nr:glycosyltransferase [Penaeicola halotolerans]